jgi:DNA polymerase III subunit gamma/tau
MRFLSQACEDSHSVAWGWAKVTQPPQQNPQSMSVSLFRRWRSQKFSDLVGQESVVSTLQNVLLAGDPARAYLFCGPRGTGKTSSARIFAKALNCENGPAAEPCNECSQCRSIADGSNLDVFEIDAASHTQVDKIRDFIVEKVHFTPVSARCKVYIIDEVHKLSTSSFNALLKTLEEPPSHVVFVLATTHPHEMPSTILSRCQRYDFRPITATETEKHLKMIASEEKIELDDDAARHLARAADGSLRDALVLFEQAYVFSDGRVTRDKVLDLLGGVGYEVQEQMFTDLVQGAAGAALERLNEWILRGRDLKRLAESFQDHLRMMLLIKVRSEDQSIRHLSAEERASLDRLTQLFSVSAITQWLRSVGEMLGQIRHGRRARLEWEMLLVALAHPESDPTIEGLQRQIERLESGGTVKTSSAALPSGPDLLPRVEALESRSEEQDSGRIQALESHLAELSHRLSALQEALDSRPVSPPEVREEPPSEVPPAPKTESPRPVPEPQGSPDASEAPILERDPVDDWLTLPEVLVTGRISRSGQISLLDSMEEAPTPEEPPEDPYEQEGYLESYEPEPEPLPEEESIEPEETPVTPAPSLGVALPESKEFFRLLMQQVKEQDIRLHAVLADARLTALQPDRFELAVPAGYDWHFGKIQEGKALLESVAQRLVPGAALQMECSIGGEKAAPPKENEHEELVKRASGVFGGSSIID